MRSEIFSVVRKLSFRSKMVVFITLTVFMIVFKVFALSVEGSTVNIAGCPLVTGGKCPDDRVRFYLFTRLNPNIGEEIIYNETTSNLLQINFNASVPTKILTHGYNSGMSIFDNLRREYLARGDFNVVAVEWAALSAGPCYPTAALNARFVGRCVAEVVLRALDVAGAGAARRLHLIGFSLGAHVPAFAAARLRPLRLARITGLDPAMPMFMTNELDSKLDASDARFVDVVHTNAMAQGKVEACGHIDFYMNGGVTQPGCHGDSGCNHQRALAYFTEAVRSEAGFWGWPCGGVMHYVLGLCPPRGRARRMGEDADPRGRGFYVLRTNSASPFARGPWQPAPAIF